MAHLFKTKIRVHSIFKSRQCWCENVVVVSSDSAAAKIYVDYKFVKTSSLLLLSHYRSSQRSANRFGEISSLWQKNQSSGICFCVYLLLGKILNLLWQKISSYWAHFHCLKLTNIEQILQPSGHTVNPQPDVQKEVPCSGQISAQRLITGQIKD